MARADGYAYRRAQMVESLRRGGIRDARLLEVMAEAPRHLFVPEALRHQAYSDDVSIHIGEGQTISQPRIVALMTEAARIGPEGRVLEIGTGSGYQAAVLSSLARFVFTIERVGSLAREAKRVLDFLGIDNVSVKVMDGTLGLAGAGSLRRHPGHRRGARGARTAGGAACRRRPPGGARGAQGHTGAAGR